jgi:Arc/MetJ-type ribon-helix-helix transcriptional regulator
MSMVQIPDDVRQLIARQVAAGRASSEADFLAEAVQRYADALEAESDDIIAAADEGIEDIEAGRFELIAGPDDQRRLRAELSAGLDQAQEAAS